MPFGPNIRALLAHLHRFHHVGFERLARVARELFGLFISEGAIANAMRRMGAPLEVERDAIRAKLRAAEVVWSDETPPASTAIATGTGWSSRPMRWCTGPRPIPTDVRSTPK